MWYIDANLHIWLDKKSVKTEGQLLRLNSLPPVVTPESNFTDLNGKFLTSASRSISSTGWVRSSHGKITTNSIQSLNYSNIIVVGNDGDLTTVNQIINFNDSVYAMLPSSSTYSIKSFKRFPLSLYFRYVDQGNGFNSLVTNITLGFNEEKVKDADIGFLASSLKNLQDGHVVLVAKGNLLVSRLWSTKQAYQYDGTEFCYFRNVTSSNDTILYDKKGNTCSKKI